MTDKEKEEESLEELTAKTNELIMEDRNRRVNLVQAGLEKLLKDHNCSLEVSVLITANGNLPQLGINAN